jgi:hypothetical protein
MVKNATGTCNQHKRKIMKQELIHPVSGWRVSKTGRILLAFGFLSSLLYLVMNIYVPMQYSGYNPVSQVISELSAVGAPTRTIWFVLGTVYTLLVAVFGWAVWKSAGDNRPLRRTGFLLGISGIIGLGWSFAPMHQREVLAAGGGTISETFHIVFSVVTVLLMMLAIGFGAAAFGRKFRLYSIATLVLLAVFGILTGIDGPKMEANEPTPWIGVWERICIGVYMLWVMVLSYRLLQKNKTQVQVTAPEAGMITGMKQIKTEVPHLQEDHH